MNKCKICGNDAPHKTYCSNKCKFADTELNKRRRTTIKNDKNLVAECNLCLWKTKDINNLGGYLDSHLRKTHGIESEEFKSFYSVKQKEIKQTVKCPECAWTTVDINNKSGCLRNHLLNKHNLLPHDVVIKYPEFKEKWSRYFSVLEQKEFLFKDSKNRIKCEGCGEYFKKLSNSHLSKHGLSPTQYKEKYSVTTTASKYTAEIQSELTTKFNLINGTIKKKSSSLEDDFIKKITGLGIVCVSPFLFKGKKYDVYLPELNSVVEIDGKAFHPDSLNDLTIQTVNSVLNDISKNGIMQQSPFKFIRIRYDIRTQFSKLNLLEQIKLLEYSPNYSVQYKQQLLHEEYFRKYLQLKGQQSLRRYIPLLLKFKNTIQPTFPTITTTESLTEIISNLQDRQTKLPINNTFNNNTSVVGLSYLRANFNSYWNSKFKRNKYTPVECWANDDIMRKVIEYRIGLNDSNEVFDFSLHQLIRGLSAYRYTISMFKPALASDIYEHFLGKVDNPIVLDPCAGFGGRMLGFYSKYPNGTYIGIEPNKDTYKELEQLNTLLGKNSILINDMYENVDISKFNYDLAFTSIPYWDTELYSQDHTKYYVDYNDWSNKFLTKIKRTAKLVVNIPEELKPEFEGINYNTYYISSNTSHFNTKSNSKSEYLLHVDI